MVAVSNTSGLAGIAHWINTRFHLKGEDQIQKNDELVAKVKLWVDAEYEGGRVTTIADEELINKINEVCRSLNRPEFQA